MRAIFAATGAAVLLFTSIGLAQEKTLACKDGGSRGNDQARFCEMREQTLNAMPRLDVDASPNGGIAVKAWTQGQILVRSKVEAYAPTDAEAKQIAGQVRVETAGTQVKANGPKWEGGGGRGWSVSYEVFVPERIDLKLETTNGGINLNGVRGDLQFRTTNGGVKLAGVSGNVRGSTTNGGVNVDLIGSGAPGEVIDVQTTNGGVTLSVPSNYSGKFRAQTTNGGVSSDFGEVPKGEGERGRVVEMTTGSGSATVKLQTTNGGVKIRKQV